MCKTIHRASFILRLLSDTSQVAFTPYASQVAFTPVPPRSLNNGLKCGTALSQALSIIYRGAESSVDSWGCAPCSPSEDSCEQEHGFAHIVDDYRQYVQNLASTEIASARNTKQNNEISKLLIDRICKPGNIIDGWDARRTAIFKDHSSIFYVDPSMPEELVECLRCNRGFSPAKNAWGECCHTGSWHSHDFQCSFHCMKGLALNGLPGTLVKLGQDHWSCCFSTKFDSTCSLSEPHSSPVDFVPECDAFGFETVSLFDDFRLEVKGSSAEHKNLLVERLEQYMDEEGEEAIVCQGAPAADQTEDITSPAAQLQWFHNALHKAAETTWTQLPGLSVANAAVLTVECYEGGYPAIIVLTKVALFGARLFYIVPSSPGTTVTLIHDGCALHIQCRRLGWWYNQSEACSFVQQASLERNGPRATLLQDIVDNNAGQGLGTGSSPLQNALHKATTSTMTNVPGLSVKDASVLTLDCCEGGYPAIIVLTKGLWYGARLFFFVPTSQGASPTMTHEGCALSVRCSYLGGWVFKGTAMASVEQARLARAGATSLPWACSLCTFENDFTDTICKMCAKAKHPNTSEDASQGPARETRNLNDGSKRRFQDALHKAAETTWTQLPGLSVANAAVLTVECYEGDYPAIIVLTKVAWYGARLFYFMQCEQDEIPTLLFGPSSLSVRVRGLGQWSWESTARAFVEQARLEREKPSEARLEREKPPEPFHQVENHTTTAIRAAIPTGWACLQCTFENGDKDAACSMCGQAK